MTQNQESQVDVLSVLVSNDRSELSKVFGVGLYPTDNDTVEQVKAKCQVQLSRLELQVAYVKAVLAIPDANLKSEMRKAKAYRYIQSLTEDDKAALKELIGQ
ncbi:hypothetical protein I6E53_00055 [Phocaeicola vulgatus]|jgi:hypothetical protein|uniref:hypothetical protein n=1 Tax=Phocaeicola vulgatus TaxID=821 RepID=UPI001F20DF11|nr:hypothetical protein [Phocaeicola vulgatus]MCF2604932.1 hypothetical protein [Phocaeicola vulgatus]